MNSEKSNKNNVLKNGYISYFWVLFFNALVLAISDVMDTAMAGSIFNLDALAAVSICGLYGTLIYMITKALTQGYGIAMGKAMGKGDKEATNILFTQSLCVQILICTFFAVIAFVFASPLVYLFGAHDEKIISYAIPYLRMIGISSIFIAPNQVFNRAMMLYGYKKECSVLGMVELVLNVVFSLLFALVFKMGVTGLALGTAVGKISSSLYMYMCCRLKPRGLTMCFSMKNLFSSLKSASYGGLPICTTDLGDIVLGTILNNIIAFTIGTEGLAVFALYKSIRRFGKITTKGSVHSLSFLATTLFGARDVEGLKYTLKTSNRMPVLVSIVFSVIMLIFRVPILNVFGCTDTALYSLMTGAFLWLILRNAICTVQKNITSFYNFTGKIGLSIMWAVEVDIIIYIPVCILSLKLFGISGIWIGDALTYVLFFIINSAVILIKKRKMFISTEDFMLLPKDFYDEKNLLNFSITNKGQQVFCVAEQVESFLINHGYNKKIAAHCALCIEELMTRIVKKNANVMDIRLFVSEGNINLSIRDDGEANNHLVYEPVDLADGAGIRIIRNSSKSVDYKYMAGFNALNVQL